MANILEKYLYLIDPKVVSDFPHRYTKDKQIYECHTLSHELGKRVYQRFDDIKNALKSCTANCNYGCSHGVVSALHKTDIVAELIQNICPQSERFNMPSEECYHTLGHALYNNDHDILHSMKQCETAADYSAECKDGVMMEYVHHTLPQNKELLPQVMKKICQNPNANQLHCAGTTGAFLVYLYFHDAKNEAEEVCKDFEKVELMKHCQNAVAETTMVLNDYHSPH